MQLHERHISRCSPASLLSQRTAAANPVAGSVAGSVAEPDASVSAVTITQRHVRAADRHLRQGRRLGEVPGHQRDGGVLREMRRDTRLPMLHADSARWRTVPAAQWPVRVLWEISRVHCRHCGRGLASAAFRRNALRWRQARRRAVGSRSLGGGCRTRRPHLG